MKDRAVPGPQNTGSQSHQRETSADESDGDFLRRLDIVRLVWSPADDTMIERWPLKPNAPTAPRYGVPKGKLRPG